MRGHRLHSWLVVLALGWLVCAGTYLAETHYPYTPDSFVYIAAAESLTERGDLSVPFAPTTAESLPVPYTAWPPGYPVAIALLSGLGVESWLAARILSAIGLLVGILFFARVIQHDRRSTATVLLLCVTLQSAVTLQTAWTEGLFLACVMGAWWGMYNWLAREKASFRDLVLASVCACGAMQLRYAGVLLVPALIWLTWRRGHRIWRWAGTSLHVLAAAPLGLWLYRNAILTESWRGGEPTGVSLWRPFSEWCLALGRLCLVPWQGFVIPAAALGLSLTGVLMWFLWRRRDRLTEPMIETALVFAAVLGAGSVAARGLGHLWILDARVVWPAWGFVALLLVNLAPAAWDRTRVWLPLLGLYVVLQSVGVFALPRAQPSWEARQAAAIWPDEQLAPGPLLANRGWTVWKATGQHCYYLPFAYYRGEMLAPDTLAEWARRRGVSQVIWQSEDRTDAELKEIYGPLGPALARPDTTRLEEIWRDGGLSLLKLRPDVDLQARE